MKKFLLRTLLLLLLVAAPANAAIARTYPDALAKAGKNPIVIFIYGANYDKVGCLIKKEKMRIMPQFFVIIRNIL